MTIIGKTGAELMFSRPDPIEPELSSADIQSAAIAPVARAMKYLPRKTNIDVTMLRVPMRRMLRRMSCPAAIVDGMKLVALIAVWM